jgi:hypothetical protein
MVGKPGCRYERSIVILIIVHFGLTDVIVVIVVARRR